MTASTAPARVSSSPARSHREDRRLRRRALGGDEHAQRQLIEKHLPLATDLARRYRRSGEPLDDLVQVARLGLVNAARRWDSRRGPFIAYAMPTILGELRRYFRDSAWPVRPPRGLQETYRDILGVRDALLQELGREPTIDDLAKRLALTREAVAEALRGARAHAALSLDRPLGATPTCRDALVDRRDDLARCEDAVALAQLSATLSARERDVIRLRFQSDLLQEEIAARIGCSQVHVSRILRGALLEMRRVAESRPA
jgi:RNA polymerase sigma-B factor